MDQRLLRMKELSLRALHRALQGGVEGVTIQELIGFLQVKPLLARGMSQGLSTAEAFWVVRRCQAETSQDFTLLVCEAVEDLEREKKVVVTEDTVILITEVGRRPFLKEGDDE